MKATTFAAATFIVMGAATSSYAGGTSLQSSTPDTVQSLDALLADAG